MVIGILTQIKYCKLDTKQYKFNYSVQILPFMTIHYDT
jgi:hypothetical protein